MCGFVWNGQGRAHGKRGREGAEGGSHVDIRGKNVQRRGGNRCQNSEWGARGDQGTAGAGRGVSDEREGPWAVSSVREPGPGGLAGHWVASGPGFG